MQTPPQQHPSPADRFAVPALAINLKAAADELRRTPGPAPHGRRQVTLSKHGNATIALFVFDAGAILPPHNAPGTVSIHVIEGTLAIGAAETKAEYTPGGMLILAPGVRHDVTALTDAVMLLHVCLAPAAANP